MAGSRANGCSHSPLRLGDVAVCVDMNIKKNTSKPHNPATPKSVLSSHRLTLRRRTSMSETANTIANKTDATAIGER